MLSRVMYAVAVRLPHSTTQRLQDVVSRNRRARRIVQRLSAPVRTGARMIAEGPAKGLLMDVAGSRPSYLLGRTETDVVAVIEQHLRRGGVMFDLGANVGYFTLIGAALAGPSGRVVAVEPLPANARALRRNIELNNLTSVEVLEAAASAEAGRATLDVHPDTQKSALATGDAAHGLDVQVVTVDAESERRGISPTLLKIDVEGAELDALRGAERVLRNDRPVVLCEIHTDRPQLSTDPVAGYLREHGYAVRWLEDVDGRHFWAPHLIATP